MKVVHIIKATGIAGAERHLLTLLSGLRAHNIDIHLILLHPPHDPLDTYVELLTARSIPVTRLPIHRHLDPKLLPKLRDAIRELKPDIVHTHLLHADLYGTLAAKWAGVRRVIQSRHNDDAMRRRLPLRLINRALWSVASDGIGISHAVTRFCIEVEGTSPRKMHTIHYGMELPVPVIDRADAQKSLRTLISAPDDAVIVGMVGRAIEQKGFGYGLRAFAQVADAFPNAHLVVAGDGVLRVPLQAEAKRLNLTGRAHFVGWRDDVPQIMAALDIFLMPSLWEGFGLVLLEAMSRAVPVIGSAVSAIPEVVSDEETGLLVPPRDEAAIAEALRRLLADPALRRHMGLLGEDRLEDHFNAAHMVEATAKVYTR